MKHINVFSLLLSSLLLLISAESFGQLRIPGIPPSSEWNLRLDEQSPVTLKAPAIEALTAEDQQFPTPYRFAVTVPADISPDLAGTWTSVPGGGKIWRVTVSLPGAQAVSVYFDRFYIPERGRLFLYDPNKKQILGAFTSLNNSSSRLFATELIAGDRVTLEYYTPDEDNGLLQLHVNEIAYAYRGVESLTGRYSPSGNAGSCEVNVHCSEGDNWQNQVKGVTRIQVKRSSTLFWCSGSVLNNARLDGVPYVLTADHCGMYSSDTDLQQWIFYFDYEAPGCTDPSVPPVPNSLTGAVLKSHGGSGGSTGSDFYLVRLSQNIPDSFNVYYIGWNRKDTTSPRGVGIHHPQGDLKKISTYNTNLVTSNWNGGSYASHWRVHWIQTEHGHGVTEGGSSGSPLFDYLGRIVGTLTGGESSCDSADLNQPDYYGKFSYSWLSNGPDSTTRLSYWLDPDNTGVYNLDGWALSVPQIASQPLLSIFPNPVLDKINISAKGLAPGYYSFALYDVVGVQLRSKQIWIDPAGPLQLSAEDLPDGIYFIRIWNEKLNYAGKFIKE